MKRTAFVLTLVALAACDSATGTGANRQEREAQAHTEAPGRPSYGGGAAGEPHRAVIAAVRKKTTGSPSTYEAKGVAVDGGQVYIEVRSSTTGFSTLTSGTSVTTNWGTGETTVSFNATSGTRYMVVVYPMNGSLVDNIHAVFLEAVP
ncbi:MAG TPA: hypothetical protein VFQ45_05610 [Longimicrobium sp.]|nr:hypothetical protein [Longimicrobium sp.]